MEGLRACWEMCWVFLKRIVKDRLDQSRNEVFQRETASKNREDTGYLLCLKDNLKTEFFEVDSM